MKNVWTDGCLRDLAAQWDARAAIIELSAEDKDFEAAHYAMRRAAAVRACARELRDLVCKLLADNR